MNNEVILAWHVCGPELPRAIDLANWILELGGTKEYDLLLVLAESAVADKDGSESLTSALKKAFRDVRVVHGSSEILPSPRKDGSRDWLPNNAAFVSVLNILALATPNQETPKYKGFYFFESDCTPLKPSWLDDVASEFMEKPELALGCIRPMNDIHGNTIAGSVMNGSAIYPVNFKTRIPTLSHSINQDHKNAQPWDVLAREHIVANGRHTKLIQVDFKLDPWKSKEHLKEQAVVFHGCKDGSLVQLLRSIKNTKEEDFSVSKPVKVEASPEVVPVEPVAVPVAVPTITVPVNMDIPTPPPSRRKLFTKKQPVNVVNPITS